MTACHESFRLLFLSDKYFYLNEYGWTLAKLWECGLHPVHVPNQWETTLHCNVVSHWLDDCREWTLGVFGTADISIGLLTLFGLVIKFYRCGRSNSPIRNKNKWVTDPLTSLTIIYAMNVTWYECHTLWLISSYGDYQISMDVAYDLVPIWC